MEAARATDYKGLYEASQQRVSELELTVSTVLHELAQLKKMIYGARSERSSVLAAHPSQLSLDMVTEEPAPAAQGADQTTSQQISYTRTGSTDKKEQKNVSHPGRNPLPAHLRREDTILEPGHIPAGAKRIGEEITEVLEYAPGELYVKRIIRPKYASPSSTDATATDISIAPMPARPLDKAIAGPALLTYLVTQKYIYHLPLYRLLAYLESLGIKLPYSTLTDWVGATARLITPLYEALKAEVLRSCYLHADETPIKVQDRDKKGTTHRGWFWVYNNSPGKLVFFDYREGRDEQGPKGILEGYKGYLQTDGYVGYDSFEQTEGITRLFCMAHARRKFTEAIDNDRDRCNYALERMGQLYGLERKCKEEGLDNERRKAERQAVAVPILAELGVWMKEQYVQVLPKSPVGKALAYSLERWEGLSLYTTDGMLCIDNNPVENSIRPVAVGRKNYLFCGSHEAAKRTAMLYSLLGTCKMNGVDPSEWLHDVLERIPTHPVNRIGELLPHRWKPRQQAVASAG